VDVFLRTRTQRTSTRVLFKMEVHQAPELQSHQAPRKSEDTMAEENERLSQGFGNEPQGGADGGELRDKLKEQAERATASARDVAEKGKDRLADGAQGVAQALHQASDNFRSEEHAELAGYTQSIADKLDQLAGALKGRNLATLADDVTRLARRQPALFLGGAFTAGLIAARFLKSSASQGSGARSESHGQSAYGHPSAAPPPATSTDQSTATAGGYGPAPGGYGPSSPTGEHGGNGIFGTSGAGGGSGNDPGSSSGDDERGNRV